MFIRSGNSHLYTHREEGGGYYPHHEARVPIEQADEAWSIRYTEEGFKGLRSRYDQIKGLPAFVTSILNMDTRQKYVHDLAEKPECFPFFQKENFLIIPNKVFDPEAEYLRGARSQKLKDKAITTVAWFVHPHSSCINDRSRQLLAELSDEFPAGQKKSFIEQLRKDLTPTSNASYENNSSQRDDRTIAELREDGKYFASILDLGKGDVDLLKSLKNKTLRHLAEQYGVGANDQVALYFHFPYSEWSTTLHMHIRVNHGSHPFEEHKSFTLDEIIAGLSRGKRIEDVILEKQELNGGTTLKDHPNAPNFYKDVPGLEVKSLQKNTLKLSKEGSEIVQVYSRDDLHGIRPEIIEPVQDPMHRT